MGFEALERAGQHRRSTKASPLLSTSLPNESNSRETRVPADRNGLIFLIFIVFYSSLYTLFYPFFYPFFLRIHFILFFILSLSFYFSFFQLFSFYEVLVNSVFFSRTAACGCGDGGGDVTRLFHTMMRDEQLVSREVLDLKNRLGMDLENPALSIDPEKVSR